MQDNDKVTLTFGQLKKLLKESNVPDMPSPRKFTTNIKEYFKKRFGMKLETLKDYPSYLFKKIIDRRFNGDANALLKFFKENINTQFVLTQYVLVTKKGNPFVAKMPFPWYDDLMDKFVLGGITFDIIGDDNAAKAKWYDGSYVFPSEIDDDDIDTGKWKKVTWYQILGYIENAFKEDWAIGIDSVVEGVMDEYEIPYDNNEAYNKVEDLVAELWSKNRRAIINRYYKSHSSTDKFFDSID